MKKILGLFALGLTIAIASTCYIPSQVMAQQPLFVAYPPAEHKTTSSKIFLIGTAPQQGEVLINGQTIDRSPAGHFAPSFPLKLGENLFTLRYQNQELKIKVTRESNSPELPQGLAFAKDSLTPAADIAKMPGELICFGAIAPADATVAVELGGETIPLNPQPKVELQPNNAVLTGQNQPTTLAGQYQGCAAIRRPVVPESDTKNLPNKGALDLGQPKFLLTLSGQTISQMGPGKISILSPVQFEIVEVTADGGTARTGPSTDYSRMTPLPKGTQASVTGKEGEWLRLDYGAWINQKEVKILSGSVPPKSIIRGASSRQVGEWTEVLFPLQVPVPVTVQQGSGTFTLTLYNTTAQTDTIRLDDDPVISRLDWQQIAPEQVQYTFNLKSQQQWGYKLRYEGTTLVLSLRHPPATSSGNKSLTGVKILLDPGHGGPEDLGSRGPTGYPEKNVALIVSKLVRENLVQRGATVLMTREGDDDIWPNDRAAAINKQEPNLSISIHYNALPDNGDAINTKGVGTFWYQSQSQSLAMFLHNYLVEKLGRSSYGVYWNNLALTRPAVAPSVLLELGFMINPVEFEWIVNPEEQKKLAGAIADGVVEWIAASK